MKMMACLTFQLKGDVLTGQKGREFWVAKWRKTNSTGRALREKGHNHMSSGIPLTQMEILPHPPIIRTYHERNLHAAIYHASAEEISHYSNPLLPNRHGAQWNQCKRKVERWKWMGGCRISQEGKNLCNCVRMFTFLLAVFQF